MKVNEILRENSDKDLRLAIQSGTVDKTMGFALRSTFKKIIEKHTTGSNWEIKQSFLDTGLYYTGEDVQEVVPAMQAIIGDLYGFFQNGPKREITRVVKEDDDISVTYVVKPVDAPSQIQFFHLKRLGPDGAVLGVSIKPKR